MRSSCVWLVVVALLTSDALYAQSASPTAWNPPETSPWLSTIVIGRKDNWIATDRLRSEVTASESAITKFGDRAARDGDVLRLRLADAAVIKLYDEGFCQGFFTCVRHQLIDWWPTTGYYVVAVTHGEGGWAYLIRERDGRVMMVTAPPILSPSGRQAVALVSNLMHGVELEIIDLGRDPPTLTKVAAMPACAGAGPNSYLRPTPVWIDESHVRFEGTSPMPGDDPNAKQHLRIVDGKPEWEC